MHCTYNCDKLVLADMFYVTLQVIVSVLTIVSLLFNIVDPVLTVC